MRNLIALLLAIGTLTVFPVDLSAQSGTKSYGGGSGTRTVQQPFERRLWTYLQSMHYRNWAPAPGQKSKAYPGESPHGAQLKMYLNRTAIGNGESIPEGSVIVKENYGADGKTLLAITVMYRSKGFDRANNDWYWVKYNPDGGVSYAPAAQGGRKLAGKVTSCIECHATAQGKDYVFFND